MRGSSIFIDQNVRLKHGASMNHMARVHEIFPYESIILTKIYHVSKGSWQPGIYPRMSLMGRSSDWPCVEARSHAPREGLVGEDDCCFSVQLESFLVSFR